MVLTLRVRVRYGPRILKYKETPVESQSRSTFPCGFRGESKGELLYIFNSLTLSECYPFNTEKVVLKKSRQLDVLKVSRDCKHLRL